MNSLIFARFLLCLFTLGFVATRAHANVINNDKDSYGNEASKVAEAKEDDEYLEGEKSKENAEDDSGKPGPKNVVLFFGRFPTAKKKYVTNKSNGTDIVYTSFPVRATVGVNVDEHYSSGSFLKPKKPKVDKQVAASGDRRESPSQTSLGSCKGALDANVAALLTWARNSKCMATGVVSNGKHSHEMSMTKVARAKGGMERLHEYKKEDLDSSKSANHAKGKRNAKESHDEDVAEDADKDKHRDECLEKSLVSTVAVSKREVETLSALPPPKVESPMDPFRELDVFRRFIFDSLFNSIGFDLADNVDTDLQEMDKKAINPGTEMVRSVLKGLQADSGDKGFVLVVSAGKLENLNDVVRLVKERTNEEETLIAVTGQCPGDETDAIGLSPIPNLEMMFKSRQMGMIRRSVSDDGPKLGLPLYATGPKSDLLGEVSLLWDVPKTIQQILKEDLKRNLRSPASTAVKQPPSKTHDVDNANDNGLVRGTKLEPDDADDVDDAFIKHDVDVDDADELHRNTREIKDKGKDSHRKHAREIKDKGKDSHRKHGRDVKDVLPESHKKYFFRKVQEEQEDAPEKHVRDVKKEAREAQRKISHDAKVEDEDEDETSLTGDVDVAGVGNVAGLWSGDYAGDGGMEEREVGLKKKHTEDGGKDAGAAVRANALVMVVGVVMIAVYIKILVDS